MAKKYPLHELVTIKKKKLEEAERILREKKEKLAQEEEKLEKAEKARDKVKKHRLDKLEQLRNALDEGQGTGKLMEKRTYLKLVDEKLAVEEKRVQDQIKQVDLAKQEVERAREEMIKRQKDVEKLAEHKKEWNRDMLKELELEEGREGDEMGTSRYISEKKKKKK